MIEELKTFNSERFPLFQDEEGSGGVLMSELNSREKKQTEKDISDAMAQAMLWIRKKQEMEGTK